jgi:hypothetical protein
LFAQSRQLLTIKAVPLWTEFSWLRAVIRKYQSSMIYEICGFHSVENLDSDLLGKEAM